MGEGLRRCVGVDSQASAEIGDMFEWMKCYV